MSLDPNQETTYFIAGSSHAALEALHAIRMVDQEGSLVLATRDSHMPYSPTVLPYVVSGRSRPDNIALRDEGYFADNQVTFLRGDGVASVDPADRVVTLESGDSWRYDKLLLATGATPAIPPVEGLDGVEYHVLRTLDDATGLRQAMGKAKSAVVLGGGLVGMHAAENLVEAGLQVSLVEMESRVLPAYFDADAAGVIQEAFDGKGARMMLGRKVTAVREDGKDKIVVLDGGEEITADLLLVSTGVTPQFGYLNGAGIETDRGILVDDTMATSAEGVWAAGDVAQARGFYSADKVINGILPEAVEQGRLAGMAMADDPALGAYPGGVPSNTYNFFGQKAISVGLGGSGNGEDDLEVQSEFDSSAGRYQKILMQGDRLLGIATVNQPLDPGVMWQLILRQVDLGPVKDKFIADPLGVGRTLMSEGWR